MDDLQVLKSLKYFLTENVSKRIKLECPPKNNVLDEEYKLVNPAVYIGWLPPKNFLQDYDYDVPSILIMSDGGSDEGDEAGVNIRLVIATYDPGQTLEEGTQINFKGYKDLLNIITKIRIALTEQLTLNCGIINKPIKWSMYEEQSYPYWHASMEFKVDTVPFNFNTNNFL